MSGELSLYQQALDTITDLERLISSKGGESNLRMIGGALSTFKQDINRISLNLNLSMDEKLDFYFSLIHRIMMLTNKYQANYNKYSSLALFGQNFIELRILNQYIMWVIVSNAHNHHRYKTQISANLLSKVLESQSFQVEESKPVLTDKESLDSFGRLFNYHQTSAGLYTSAISFLDQIHIDNARDWINRARYHFRQIYMILKTLDFASLKEVVESGSSRDFPTLLTIFIWPSLDFLALLKSIHVYFGTNWHSIIKPENPDESELVKAEYIQHLIDLFEDIRTEVLSLYRDPRTLTENANWNTYESILAILKQRHFVITMFEKPASIDTSVLDRQLEYIDSIFEFSKTTSRDTILQYHLGDGLQKLVMLAVKSTSKDVEYLYDIISMIPNFVNKMDHNRDHAIILLYSIAKYNLLRNYPHLGDLSGLLEEIQGVISQIGFDTADSVMLRILNILLHYEDRQPVRDLKQEITQIKTDIVPKLSHPTHMFESYLAFLFGLLSGEQPSLKEMVNYENIWDWRTWLLPELKSKMIYLPLNAKSFTIVTAPTQS